MEAHMDIQNAVAVVTGANRGFGRQLAAELLKRGAKKVYAVLGVRIRSTSRGSCRFSWTSPTPLP